jgi:hypothetical protein
MVRTGGTEHRHDARQRSLGARAHVQRLDRHPDRVDAHQRTISRSQLAQAQAPDIGQRTRTLVVPRCTSNPMNCAGSLITAPTVTGTHDAAVLRSPSNSRLHLCTRLALIPWAIATAATNAPCAAAAPCHVAGVCVAWHLPWCPLGSPLVDTILVFNAGDIKTGSPDAYRRGSRTSFVRLTPRNTLAQ